MTITSVQTLLPGRYSVNVTEKRAEKPPPQIYSVQDYPFKGYQPPQPDGYEQSKAHPDTSAIVIDNGSFLYMIATVRGSILTCASPMQALTLSRPVGPLTRIRDSSCLPS